MIRRTVCQLTYILSFAAAGCGGTSVAPSATPATPVVASTPPAVPIAPAEPAVPLGEAIVVRPARIQFRTTADYEVMGPGMLINKKGQGQINIQFTIGTVDAQSGRLSANLQAAKKNGVRSEDLPPTPSGLTRKLFSYEEARTPSEQVDEWTLLIGRDRWTTSVKVRIPAGIAKEKSPTIRAMLLSADAIPADTRPVDSLLGFHLADSMLLKAAQVSHWVDYTVSGDMNLKSAAEPLLALNPQMSSNGKQGEEAADVHLNAIRGLSMVNVTSRKPIELAGMSGFETEATALKAKAEVPVVVYSLVLFTPRGKSNFGDLTVHGTVGKDFPDHDKFLSEFRRMAHGLTKE